MVYQSWIGRIVGTFVMNWNADCTADLLHSVPLKTLPSRVEVNITEMEWLISEWDFQHPHMRVKDMDLYLCVQTAL